MSKFDDAVTEAMRVVKVHGTLTAIKKEAAKIDDIEEDEAKRVGMNLEKYNDLYPREWNCYFEFDDEGQLANIVFDGESYYPGHSGGAVAQITVHGNVTMEEIKREIGETLYNSEIFEEE